MTLLLLLAVGALGALGTGWALPRGGAATQLGALGGVAAMAVLGVLALASPTPDASAVGAVGGPPGTLFNGALVPGAYLRVAMALWSVSAVAVAGIVWLLRGSVALRGVMPAALAAQAGAAVALAASTPELGLVAGGATGLASIPVLLASSRPRVGVAAREVRIAVATAAVALGVAAGAAALSRLVLASPQASTEGSGVAAAAAFGILALALAVAARVGVFPYHVRVSALADAVPDGALPLVLVWLPFPLVVAGLDLASGPFASLVVPIGAAQALLIGLLVLATVAAAVGAGLQDDLRHAVGYLTVADLGLVVLAFAALSEAAWAPARTWLLMAALTKTALAAWAAVVEDRFASRSVPDLRGWLRPSPVLGIALALIVLATYGLPGWAVLSARVDLVQAAAGAPWNAVLLGASLLTLPAYARWAWLGIGAPTSHVDRAAPDLLAARMTALPARRLAARPPSRSRRGDEGLPVEHEGHAAPSPAAQRTASRATGSTTAARDRQPSAARRPTPPATPAVVGGTDAPTPPAPPRPSRLTVTVSGARRPAASAAAGTRSAANRAAAETLAAKTAVGETATTAAESASIVAAPTPDPVALAATPPDARPDVEPEQLAAFTAESPQPAESAGAPEGVATIPQRVAADAAEPRADTPRPDTDAAVATAEAAAVTPPDAAGTANPAEVGADAPPGVRVSPRSRAAGRKTKPSAMATPRHPEASIALPLDVEPAAEDAAARADAASARSPRAPRGQLGAPARAAVWTRSHRTDAMSGAVLALALLAALVAFGAFDVAGAARETTPAGPVVTVAGN